MNPPNPPLQVHPALRIMHRKGVLYAAHRAGQVPPAQIAEPDLCLLFAFLDGADPAQVVQRLCQGDLVRYMPAPPPPENVVARVQQLVQSQVLAPAASQLADAQPQRLADCSGESPANSGDLLRLPKHFALRPAGGGFAAWSARDGREWLLDLELSLLLCGFAQGKPVSQVLQEHQRLADPPRLSAAAGWLRRHGLLCRVVRHGKDAAEQRPAAVMRGLGPDWSSLQPDGRIPVYFTPHMENHYPLALGMIFSAIGAHREGALLERFLLVPISYMSPQQLFDGPYRRFGPGVWLFSNYMWSVDFNLQVSRGIKSHHPGNLCVHGGPSTPGYKEACEAFMRTHPSVDVSVHGEGEMAACELLECVDRDGQGRVRYDTERLRAVHGLTFRDPAHPDGLSWTPPRVRMKEPDSVPSPYLAGVFDAYRGRVEAAIIESNRGCPFGCTFCDWGSATSQKVRKFDLERVKKEIDWIGRTGVPVLWIADANYGMYDRDIELAQHIVATKARHGYPREVVVNYTKNTTRRLVEIIRAFSDGGIISQGIISIQTTDEATLEVINRRNIKTEVYDELAGVFADARLPLSTDLMIGLPGITPAAWDRDLQRYFDADVSVKAYPTQLLPNSPMADPEYRAKYRIEVDEKDFVVACHSFDRAELEAMKAAYYAFEIADGYGLLRYVLRYLQWEHGLKAMVVLHRLLDVVRDRPADYPALAWVLRFFRTEKTVPGGWREFYDQLGAFITTEYGIERDPALETALRVNEAAMPDDTLAYPRQVELDHDFTAWFLERKAAPAPVRSLRDYPAASFVVDDPDLMAHIDMDYLQYDSHQYFWELRSAIARPKSVSDVKDIYQGAA